VFGNHNSKHEGIDKCLVEWACGNGPCRKHQCVNLRAGQRVRLSAAGVIHVQNVNAYHQRFRQWLAPFRGVASRYLPNYLGWRWALDMGRIATTQQLFSIAVKLIYTKR